MGGTCQTGRLSASRSRRGFSLTSLHAGAEAKPKSRTIPHLAPPCDDGYSASADAGLYAEAHMVQRDVALAEVLSRCNGRDRCRWLCNGRPAQWLPHVACIKGVLGDAVRFETGATRASMALQARLEARHARRAGLVITPSQYCARRLAELYGVKNAAVVRADLIEPRHGVFTCDRMKALHADVSGRFSSAEQTVVGVRCRGYAW
jgi:hypothetical protein